jgi:hypothetical protein
MAGNGSSCDKRLPGTWRTLGSTRYTGDGAGWIAETHPCPSKEGIRRYSGNGPRAGSRLQRPSAWLQRKRPTVVDRRYRGKTAAGGPTTAAGCLNDRHPALQLGRNGGRAER